MKEISQYPSDELDYFITDREIVKYFWDLNNKKFNDYLLEKYNIKFELNERKSKKIDDQTAIEHLEKHFELNKYWKRYGKNFRRDLDNIYIYREKLYYMTGIPGHEPTIIMLENEDIRKILNNFNYKKRITSNLHTLIFTLLFLLIIGSPFFVIDLFDKFYFFYIGFIFIWIIPFIYFYRKLYNYKIFKVSDKYFIAYKKLFSNS